MEPVKYILFDAANTLIHKPDLWTRLKAVFTKHNIYIPEERIQYHHKMVSEFTDFPDQTSKQFYDKFNTELLASLGIAPSDNIIDDIFETCKYLPWQPFEDTACLKEFPVPIGILSNFNQSLTAQIETLFGKVFSDIIVSGDLPFRKPQKEFFAHAVDAIGFEPGEILYIGDSFKLDILPALRTGLTPLLIDRIGMFSASPFAITDLHEIKNHLRQ